MNFTKYFLYCSGILLLTAQASTPLNSELQHLQQAYPQSLTPEIIQTLADENKPKPNRSWEEKLRDPSLMDQIHAVNYPLGKIDLNSVFMAKHDPGRIRFQPLFEAMYGHDEKEVRAHLTTVAWMPQVFKKPDGSPRYQIRATTINGVAEKLTQISTELESLVRIHPEYIPYLDLGDAGGVFSWRKIANSNRISVHSFGIAMDINPQAPYSDYWQYGLKKNEVLDHRGRENSQLAHYARYITPWPIVLIFEKYKFIWGGKWYHYDTMHFEYRPELF